MTGKRKSLNGEDSSASTKKSKSAPLVPDTARRSSRLIESQEKANTEEQALNSPRIRKASEKAASSVTATYPASNSKNGAKSTISPKALAMRGRWKKSSLGAFTESHNPKSKIRKATKSSTTRRSTSMDNDVDISEHSIILESISPEDHEALSNSLRQGLEALRGAGNDQDLSSEDQDADVDTPNYWLMKAEPESRIEKGVDVKFSIDDLMKVDMEGWDGVRNAVARNNMRQMLKGDLAFFYHSNCIKPGIAGIMEVVVEHTTDDTAFDPASPYYDPKSDHEKPKWCLVHVAFRHKFESFVSLKELQKYAKDGGPLQFLQTLKQTRLSVSKVSKKEWDFIIELGGGFSESSVEGQTTANAVGKARSVWWSPPPSSQEPKRRKKAKLTTEKRRREAREASGSGSGYGYGYHEPDPDNPNDMVKYWKEKQVYNDGTLPWIDDYYIEELRKERAEAKELRLWNKTPKPPYREKERVLARSAENGFPQPDPYDDEANCMVWNREKRERRKDKVYWSSEENEGGDDNHGDEEGVE